MNHPISITSIASISALGNSRLGVLKNYENSQHFLTQKLIGSHTEWISKISEDHREGIDKLSHKNSKYRSLDLSVLYAIYTAREAVQQAGWHYQDMFGINVGSSRGATTLFEEYHQTYLNAQKIHPLSSPTTTLGNISSWIAHDLKAKGPDISHSITCSTALHAVLNGIAWLNAGMCDKFLVGGTEAPLTPFTLAQMKALKIYASSKNDSYPCRALDLNKEVNTMVLAEGAAMACLELGVVKNRIGIIEGYGFATDILEHGASLSTDAKCLQQSMTMAIGDLIPDDIDIVISHTPGTIKGDQAEYRAIQKVFKNKMPAITTNKWKIGHTLGSSGMFNIEMGLLMLSSQQFFDVPFLKSKAPENIERVLINAVGFGGNAVSILLSK